MAQKRLSFLTSPGKTKQEVSQPELSQSEFSDEPFSDDDPFESDAVEEIRRQTLKARESAPSVKPIAKPATSTRGPMVKTRPMVNDENRGGGVKVKKRVDARQRMQEVLQKANTMSPDEIKNMGFEEENPRRGGRRSGGDDYSMPDAPKRKKGASSVQLPDGKYMVEYLKQSKRKVDEIRAKALELGWDEKRLYNNIGVLPFPYLDEYGLVCYLEDTQTSGNIIEIDEVTKDYVKLSHKNLKSGAVAHTRFMRERHGPDVSMMYDIKEEQEQDNAQSPQV